MSALLVFTGCGPGSGNATTDSASKCSGTGAPCVSTNNGSGVSGDASSGGSDGGSQATATNDGMAAAVASCGYYETLTTVCDGDTTIHSTPGQPMCLENATLCYTYQPQNTSQNIGTCLDQTTWSTVSFLGTCADFDAYNRHDGERNCLPTADSTQVPLGCGLYEGGYKQVACTGNQCICDGQPCPPPTAPGGPDASASNEGSTTMATDDAGGAAPADGGSGPPSPPSPPHP